MQPTFARSQNFSLTKPQLAKVADSLRALPLVREEAQAWRAAYLQCDSASRTKSLATAQLSQAYRAALDAEQARATQAAANGDLARLWERKATARSWRIVGVASLFLGYIFIRR